MSNEATLSGRHALVCGASSGIGRATALALGALGASVTVLARRAELLEELCTELVAAGAAAARPLSLDLEDEAAIERDVSALVAEHGAVHVLINNAGGPPSGPLLEATSADFLVALRRHLLASHRLVQLCLPGMRDAGYGRIVNIISTSVREPIPGLGVSNTTRGAMASWAKTLSRELPAGVTINNVLPGFTDTERLAELGSTLAERSGRSVEAVREGWLASVPEGRLGRPEELAAVIAFLASPAASYVRGTSIPVDGGRLSSI
jgi:3-oxoacyl-[acyl-carrier protein] reductase